MNFDGKNLLFVDFETYYRSKEYSLTELSITEYTRDPRFQVLGLGAAYGTNPPQWLTAGISDELAGIDWPNTVVIAHNVKFDGAILAWKYGIKPYAWFDTIALAKAVLGEQVSGYSLKTLAEFLGLSAKGQIKSDGLYELTAQQSDELGVYCRNDVELCRGIYEKLISRFPKSQLWHVDWTVRCFIEPRMVLDIGALENGVQTEKTRRASAIAASGLDRKILSSNLQFATYLQSRGVEVPTKTSGRTGKPTPALARTDAGLEALRLTHPELHAARLAAKSSLLETRGESLLAVGKTGAFPFDVSFSGAVQTHRYSGAAGAGGNPQNFTRKSFLREAVSAPSGQSLVVGDFASVELRILAWLSREPKLINKLVNDEDIYSDFASIFYGRLISKADLLERQFGKCAILGLGYGMGPTKFQNTVRQQTKINLSDADAKKTVELYRDTYFNVPRLWSQATQAIPLIMEGRINSLFFAPFIKARQNALVLPSGLEIKYPNLRWVGDECVYDVYKKKSAPEPTKLYGGKLIENICQAIAGELCKEAIRRAEEMGLECKGQVHDEILAVSPDGAADKGRLEAAMSHSPSWWPALKLKSEVGYGKNWATAKK